MEIKIDKKFFIKLGCIALFGVTCFCAGRFIRFKGISEDGIRIFKPNTVADDNNTPSEKEDKTTSEQLNEEHSEGMEDIETESIFTLDSAEFGDYLTQKHIENKRKITKTNVIDNL